MRLLNFMKMRAQKFSKSRSTSGSLKFSNCLGKSQEWSRVVSADVKEEYMTLEGIQTYYSQLASQNQKTVKSHLSLTLMRVKLVTI